MGYSAYNKYYYTEEKRLAFNDIIRELVEDNDIAIIEFSEIQTKDNYSTLLGDALHPSAAGMTAYAEKAIETIKNYVGA
jgi:lysophospholipase L1-like esterase